MANEFWMTDRQWAVLEPLIPTGRRGVKPRRNREVISGIVHVLRVDCRWRDCPEVYGPHTTIYNRFNRWSKAGIWQTMLAALVGFISLCAIGCIRHAAVRCGDWIGMLCPGMWIDDDQGTA